MATSLDLAITAIRSGRKVEGRQLLNLLIQQNPNNEMAWLWMSSVVENDEQRARCLYHVLAIDPENAVARQGLKVLGIVVSDSRPVKVPRDSQPIHIPKPRQKPQTGPLTALPEPEAAEPSPDAPERRPFRLDPEAITAELPFKPITSPFKPDTASDRAADNQAKDGTGAAISDPPSSGTDSRPAKRAADAPAPKRPSPEPRPGTLEPVPITPLNNPSPRRVPQVVHQQGQRMPTRQPINGIKLEIAPRQLPQTESLSQPAPSDSQPVPVQRRPSEPVPVAQSNQDNRGLAQRLGQTEPLVGASPPPAQPQPQNLQHPSEPVPVAQPNHQAGPPQPGPGSYPQQPQAAQQPWPNQSLHGNGYGSQPAYPAQTTQDTRPTQPMSTPSPATMMPGMPTYYSQQPNPGQPYGLHNNATQMMPTQPPMPHHSHAVAAMHAQATMGMPFNGQPQPFSQPAPVIHSNTTMAVPLPNHMSAQPQQQPPYPSPQANNSMSPPASPPAPRPAKHNDEDEEENINILAVIIFGSLSVTAMGGLGMLILLMFTGN